MKTVSVKDDNGKEYVFETSKRDIKLLMVVNRGRRCRIVGYYYDGMVIEPMSWSIDGRYARGEDVFNLTPYKEETVMTIKELEEKYGIKNLKIKG